MYVSDKQKEFFSDYLLENFEVELRTNDLKGLLKGLKDREPKGYFDYQKDSNFMYDPGFLYAYFWDELEVDLFRALDNDLTALLSLLRGRRQRWLMPFTYSPHNRDVTLTKELLDKNPEVSFAVEGINKLIIEEGVTDLGQRHIEGWEQGSMVVLPTSLKDHLFLSDLEVDYIGFQPVLIDGEKASPFTVFEADFQAFKDKFIAL